MPTAGRGSTRTDELSAKAMLEAPRSAGKSGLGELLENGGRRPALRRTESLSPFGASRREGGSGSPDCFIRPFMAERAYAVYGYVELTLLRGGWP